MYCQQKKGSKNKTRKYTSKEAKRILEFIESNAAKDDFTKMLAVEVQKIKENKEWKVEYMTLLMREQEKYKEGYTEGEAHGKEIEKEKNTIQAIQNLMKNLKFSIEQATTALEVPEADREKYVKMIKLQSK